MGVGLALGAVAAVAALGASKVGRPDVRAEVAWNTLPPDMQVLLSDMAIDWHGLPGIPEGPVPVRMVRVAPLYRQVRDHEWDYRGPPHVARLAERMRELLPTARERRDPAWVADRLLRVLDDGLVALPPIVTEAGQFADGRHRLFAARAVGIPMLPAVELVEWCGCEETRSPFVHPQAKRMRFP